MSDPLRTWPVITLPIRRGRKGAEESHEVQRFKAHFLQVLRAFVAFVQAGEELDLIADLGVGGEVLRLDRAAAESLGGLSFGGEILGFDPVIHQPGGFEGDRLAEFVIVHPFIAPISGPL